VHQYLTKAAARTSVVIAVVVRLQRPPWRKKASAHRGDRHDRCQALKIKLFDGDLFLFFFCPTTVMTVTPPFALQNPTRNTDRHNGHPATVTGRPSKQTRHNGHLTSSRVAGFPRNHQEEFLQCLANTPPMSRPYTSQRSPDLCRLPRPTTATGLPRSHHLETLQCPAKDRPHTTTTVT
jgi:hypothetical protein